MAMSGKIVWQAERGGNKSNRSLTNISNVLSMVNLYRVAMILGTHSKCGFLTLSVTESLLYTPFIVPGANADKKAILYFRDDDTNGIVSLSYPDPIAGDIEKTPNGERIKASVLNQMENEMAIATGKTFHALYGIVLQAR